MNALVVAIFILTYALIAARRLTLLPIGRPAGALLGAVLMVAVGGITPEESYKAVDHDTIVLLFGMMLLTAYLERDGFFERVSAAILTRCRTPRGLLLSVAVVAAGLSAFLVNDTVCLFLTPVVIVTCRRASLPMGPYLLAVATSANIGSAATLVGNPQNMIVGSLSKIHFAEFAAYSAPAAALGLAINVTLLDLYYKKKLPPAFGAVESGAPVPERSRELTLVGLVIAGVVLGFFAGFHLGYTTLVGVAVMLIRERTDPREIFAKVDWALLVFFCGLFIVVAALVKTGLADDLWALAAPALELTTARGLAAFTAVIAAGSNIVSNVPMVLVAGPRLSSLGHEKLGWLLLAFSSTVAGNLTLVGSVANIIVAERARPHYHLGFGEYLRFGFVSTIAVLAAGCTLLALIVPP